MVVRGLGLLFDAELHHYGPVGGDRADERQRRTRRRRTGGGPADDAPATWRSLFASVEYRTLWGAQALSMAGDQLARVALAVLVFNRTNSALLTAAVYAITYLPWLLGGPLLGWIADRYPRRTVMVLASLASCVLVALMAVPGMPLGVLCVLLFVVVLLEAPFLSARAALLVDVLPDDRYVLASAVNNLTTQAAQVLGFAAGGALVGVVGARQSLLLDAATFLVSALLVRLGVRARPAPARHAGEDEAAGAGDGAGSERLSVWMHRLSDGVRVVFGDRRLRGLVLLAWLASFTVVPEGLAAPWAKVLGGDSRTIGLLLAAQPLGAVIGALLLTRLVRPSRRLRLLVPLAALALVPLLAGVFRPSLQVVLVILVVAGLGQSYQLVANAAFMQTVSAEYRGQAFSLAAAGLTAGQGLGLVAAGALAEWITPPYVVACAGAAGLLVLGWLAAVGRRAGEPATPTAPTDVPDPDPALRDPTTDLDRPAADGRAGGPAADSGRRSPVNRH